MDSEKHENAIVPVLEEEHENKSHFKTKSNKIKDGKDFKDTDKRRKPRKTKFPKAGDAIFSNPEIFMTPEEILLNHGYQAEVHEVESEDGYITSLLRIPYGKGGTADNCKTSNTALPGSKRPVVLFAHGIATNAISWVLNKEENVLAYQLANKGFDCWLHNARGTQPSQKHTKLSPTSKKYWKHSWHEMSQFDIPAVINRILNICGQEQLFYVGHSMGCAVLFAAVSMHPELASKIKVMIAYAPAVYLKHSRSPFVSLASRMLPTSCLSFSYHGELYSKPTVKLMKIWAPWIWICRSRSVRDATWLMHKTFKQINGKNDDLIYWPMMPVLAAHLPSSFSVRTYEHFLQNHKSGKFQRFDFGRSKNLKEYGQPVPTIYNFDNATFPVAIFYGDNDASVNRDDIQKLAQDLPNVKLLHRVDFPNFNHFDFVIAKDIDQLLNIHVEEMIFKHL